MVASHDMLLPPSLVLSSSSSTPLPAQGAEAAPPLINSSMSPQLMALISNSVVQANGKIAIPRLSNNRTSRSVSVKRQNSDSDYLDPNVSNAAKRNPSANRAPLNPNLTQQEFMASMATNQRQQQQRGRTTAKGGQRGGRGGL